MLLHHAEITLACMDVLPSVPSEVKPVNAYRNKLDGTLGAQLLKLACAHLIRTPYYLITDADTFFLNPFSAGGRPHHGRTSPAFCLAVCPPACHSCGVSACAGGAKGRRWVLWPIKSFLFPLLWRAAVYAACSGPRGAGHLRGAEACSVRPGPHPQLQVPGLALHPRPLNPRNNTCPALPHPRPCLLLILRADQA